MDGPTFSKAHKLSKIESGDIVKVNQVNSGSNSEELWRSETLVKLGRDMESRNKGEEKTESESKRNQRVNKGQIIQYGGKS